MLRHLGIAGFGALVIQGALATYLNGVPTQPFLRVLGLGAVAVVPASVVLMLAILGVGLIQLPLKAARGSGRMMSGYSGAYLSGLILGWGVFRVFGV